MQEVEVVEFGHVGNQGGTSYAKAATGYSHEVKTALAHVCDIRRVT